MATYELLRDLPLTIESYELEGLSQSFSPEFERLTGQANLVRGLLEGVVVAAVDLDGADDPVRPGKAHREAGVVGGALAVLGGLLAAGAVRDVDPDHAGH